ncbi:response regulator [Rhodoferax sp. GW822-FHT02A01]|uniref:hybrid sensor histidine kinase/response regulator n=1 Tax=Rhodoferax sp. GW822-FHT02A01 TaxID=3141537 RepID=UPI00315DCB0F
MQASFNSVVMVVDDVPQNTRLMRSALASAGYAVVTAQDGPTALEIAQHTPPDLVLLDVRMPGMDGYEVCSRLKAQETTRHIPVIFMTASDNEDAEARCFEVGAADYITKPIMLATALARVKAHLRLQDRERRLETMFQDVVELAPDAFIFTDDQGTILRVNVRAERMFGYSRQELIGTPVVDLLPDRASPTGVRKGGEPFPVEVNRSPIQTVSGMLSMAVVRDMTAWLAAERELNASHQRLRAFAAKNEVAREDERRRVAREVHDEMGQVLTALRMDLSLVELHAGAADTFVGTKVKDMKGLVDQAIQGVRNVAGNLRPPVLDMGLVPAIEWLCRDFMRRAGVECRLYQGGEPIPLDDERSVVIFRIVQEALTNASRYASARTVDVELDSSEDVLRLVVRDDGQGFDPDATVGHRSFGLLGMRERALALGGRMELVSAPGKGTCISVTIPMRNPNPGETQ